MATLSVLKFDDPRAASRTLLALQGMQDRKMITLEDAALVSWPQGNKKPTFPQDHLAGEMALGGAFWGFLFGLIFFVPFLGRGHRRWDSSLAIDFPGERRHRRRVHQAGGRGGQRGNLGAVRVDQRGGGPRRGRGRANTAVRLRDHLDRFARG
jgi:hypothetical protein